MNKSLQFKLLLIGVITTLFLLLIIFLYLNNRSQTTVKEELLDIQPTNSIFREGVRPKIPSPSPVVIDEFSTGVLQDEFQQLEKDYPDAGSITQLIQESPFENEFFRIDYSYADLKFFVEIKPPYAAGRDAFLNFLKERGLASPEAELFSISYK